MPKEHLTTIRPVAVTFASSVNPEETDKAKSSLKTRLKDEWRDVKGGGKFPWRPTLWDQARAWLLTPQFQLALQLAIGQLWTGLFTMVQ